MIHQSNSRRTPSLAALGFAVCLVLLNPSPHSHAADLAAPIKQIAKIELPCVNGRIDHLAIDLPTKRLFVSALGNDSVEIVDVANNKYVGRMSQLKEPQGIAFHEKSNQLIVAEGEGSSLDLYDGRSLSEKSKNKQMPDADNVRLDTNRNSVFVAYGSGAIAEFDLQTGMKVAEAKLSGHPESFQIDEDGNKIYANVPSSNSVILIDRKTMNPLSSWRLPAGANYPMTINGNRLFVGCRRPPSLIVVDKQNGKILQNLPMSGDCDDLFYDRQARKLYASCGQGFIDVFHDYDGRELKPASRMSTSFGARTSLFVPPLQKLFIAAPKRGSKAAEILVFTTQ